jgi:hypothetical protein
MKISTFVAKINFPPKGIAKKGKSVAAICLSVFFYICRLIFNPINDP